mmetsp:Transcript_28538/g.68638  ORF Transcript_28538/g.68638 Transcript_28538/m.68638 type:complete len:217 (+) Transcript_28538:198-848(+)
MGHIAENRGLLCRSHCTLLAPGLQTTTGNSRGFTRTVAENVSLGHPWAEPVGRPMSSVTGILDTTAETSTAHIPPYGSMPTGRQGKRGRRCGSAVWRRTARGRYAASRESRDWHGRPPRTFWSMQLGDTASAVQLQTLVVRRHRGGRCATEHPGGPNTPYVVSGAVTSDTGVSVVPGNSWRAGTVGKQRRAGVFVLVAVGLAQQTPVDCRRCAGGW